MSEIGSIQTVFDFNFIFQLSAASLKLQNLWKPNQNLSMELPSLPYMIDQNTNRNEVGRKTWLILYSLLYWVGLSWICLNWNVRAPCMNKPFILYAVFSSDLKLKNLFAPLQECFQDVFAIPQEWLYQFSNIEKGLLNNLEASKIERKNFWTHFFCNIGLKKKRLLYQ